MDLSALLFPLLVLSPLLLFVLLDISSAGATSRRQPTVHHLTETERS